MVEKNSQNEQIRANLLAAVNQKIQEQDQQFFNNPTLATLALLQDQERFLNERKEFFTPDVSNIIGNTVNRVLGTSSEEDKEKKVIENLTREQLINQLENDPLGAFANQDQFNNFRTVANSLLPILNTESERVGNLANLRNPNMESIRELTNLLTNDNLESFDNFANSFSNLTPLATQNTRLLFQPLFRDETIDNINGSIDDVLSENRESASQRLRNPFTSNLLLNNNLSNRGLIDNLFSNRLFLNSL